MPSSSLRIPDLRRITQLVQECRDLGDDVNLWHTHLFEGLCRLTGADVGVGGEMLGGRSGRLVSLGTADWGWHNGFDRTGWLYSIAELKLNPLDTQILHGYFDAAGSGGGVSLTRRDYLADDDWYGGEHYRTCYAVAGLDDTMICFRELPGGRDEFSGLIVSRAKGSGDFSGRDRATLREAHALVAPLIGGPLARFADSSPGDLPPRVRAVLRCLLEGDGDKQIAARLGIGTHTVNQYVKHVFAHFGVNTRSELLARWVRRGWGSRCAWAD